MKTTLGIDLASQPRNTALCVIAWKPDGAEVVALCRSSWGDTPLYDKLLVSSARGLWGIEGGWGDDGRPVKVAIDAPFGWPDPFVEALTLHHRGHPWPAMIDDSRAPFERRETDRFVPRHGGKLPLAVSADRIAYPAMRCAVLLGDLSRHVPAEDLRRDGRGLVAEVYPDAALRVWLPSAPDTGRRASYKGDGGSATSQREVLLTGLLRELGPAFAVSDDHRAACIESDDCLDALVCALTAWAVERDLTHWPPTDHQRDLALKEGWIHVPASTNLAELMVR